jgi:outer membrane protein OmpA-like peptidoglycan-associated protein
MSARVSKIALLTCALVSTPVYAQFGTTPQSDCPPGLMPAPVAQANPMGGISSPTSMIASAAKKKLLSSKNSKGDSAAVDATVAAAAAKVVKPKCLTPEQYTAEMKAQQSAAMKGAATAAMSATPIGMAVVGAKAAAPYAGRAASALSNRFHRGPSKENMTKALATGRLEVENVAFDAGSDLPKGSSDKALTVLVDALKETDGLFIVRVTPESNGTTPADAKLAQKRAALITAKLIQAGVPANRVSAAPLTVATVWDSGPPKKTDAKLEIVASAPAPATDAKK